MKCLNAVICGGSGTEAWLHACAYQGLDTARAHGVYSEGGGGADARAAAWDLTAYDSFKRVISDPAVHIVELLEPMPGRTDAALAALDAGKHVLLGAPFAWSTAQSERLAAAARKQGRLLMCHENWLFYPPMRKVMSLVRKKSVGRVTGLRMRTIIAGQGGWDADLNPRYKAAEETAPGTEPDYPAMLFRDAYEKLSLALRLFGPIEEIHSVSPGAPDGRGASVITWKHRAQGTYGVLETVLAPDMKIRSAYDSRDDVMELTGSAGIIWVKRGASQMRQEPAVHAIRGENRFAYGNLDDDWMSGYTECARHFAECAANARNASPAVAPAHSAAAVAAAEAAARSAETGRRVSL